MSGTVGAQALMLLAAPFLTRLFDTEDFGLLAVYAGLLALVGVVSKLRYELAIPLPEADHEAANLVALCVLLVGATTIVSSILVLCLGETLCGLLSVPRLTKYLWLLPVGVLLSGLYTAFNYWGVRKKQFGVIAGTRWRQAFATIAIQLSAFKLGPIALLLGQAAGQSAGIINLAKPLFGRPVFRQLSVVGIGSMMRRYRRFPIFSTGEGLANTAGAQLPPLMFAGFFGAEAAGIYALAHRVLQLPMALIGKSVGQVFLANAAEARREGTLGSLVEGVHDRLARISLPPAMVLMLAGPDLFALVFGEQWRLAGECARWLSPWLYLVFVSSPMSTLFSVVERQDQGMAFQILLLAARCGAIGLGAWIGEFLIAVKLFGTFSAICWAGFLVWLGRAAGTRPSAMIRPTLSAFAVAQICSTPLWLVFASGMTSRINITIATALSGALVSGHYWNMRKRG